MTGEEPSAAAAAPGGPVPRLLGRDYWLAVSTPHTSTTADDIAAVLDTHIAWLLQLEVSGRLVLSGPLVEGPGTRPGSGMTVLRARDADEARQIMAEDPFVVAGLRSFELFRWRLNEGSVSVTVSLGTGTFRWD